ncbi:MAG TPA: hypothetical protein VF297_23685 [Pyrinomonadaceae bacterium]
MKSSGREQNLIRRYLLGDLDEKRRERLEEKVLTDFKFRKRVLLVEDELFDDYVVGALPDDERRKFAERLLATPEQVKKLEAVRAFNVYASGVAGELPPLPRPVGRDAFAARWLNAFSQKKSRTIYAAAAALAVIASVLLATLVLGPRPDERGERAALEEELALLNDPRNGGGAAGQRPAPPPPSIKHVSLSPILLRGQGEPPVVLLDKGTEVVRFELGFLGGDYLSLEATLRTVEGSEMFTVRRLPSASGEKGQVVICKVLARLLPDGDYLLTLRGTSRDGQSKDAGEYYFRVTHAAH